MANIKIDSGTPAPHTTKLVKADLQKQGEARRLVSDAIMNQLAVHVPDLAGKINNPAGFHVSFSWG